ncbi:outer membrane protein assembly factor BamA [Elusimicrobiota bacterium]
MKAKILIIFVLFFVCISSDYLFSADKYIEDIAIEGNTNVPTKRIMKHVVLKKGDEYDPSKTGKDISSIYDMGKFDDVSVLIEEVSTGTVRIIYRVEEKNRVKKIEFKGNEEIKSKKLAKKIELEEDEFFDHFIMNEDIIKVENYYKEKGFAECKVEAYSTDVENEDMVIVTYYVNEGNKIEIEEISLVGVLEEKYKKVLKQLKTKRGKVYKKDLLEEDIEKIQEYYKNNGFLNIEVEGPVLTFTPDHNFMYITFFIYEGDRYYIGEVDFGGNIKISKEEFQDELKIEKGDIYSKTEIKMDMAAVQEYYGNKGYIRMGITPEYTYNNKDNTVDIKYTIAEGPKVYVRNVYLDGNYITRDYVIEREIKIKEGEPFDLDKVRKSQSEIYKLGFFKDVRIEMLPAGSIDKTDLVFIVEEQKTGMASVGAGYSSQDKLVGTLRITQSNLFGRGQQISAMWEFGARRQNYRIDFTEPWLFNTPTPFSASIYNTDVRRYYKDYSYNELRRGGSISLGRHFTDEFSSFLKYSLEQIKIHKIHDELLDELEESIDTTSSITPSLRYDTRDYPFNPRKGYVARIANQIAGGIFGGDRDFNKFTVGATYFQPIWRKITGVLNVDAGVVREYGDSEEVPVYERFYIGGAESVRGYEYGSEIGNPEGGNYKLVGNAEIKFPIISDKGQTILQGAFFYDIGSTWKEYDDIVLKSGFENDKLRRGYGFGIRFKTRAFPIRLDWGYGIDKKPKDSQWYFTLGDIF